ncbi:MAG: phospholipase D-like domain-containing protein [Chakrabartia sp.]
MFIIPDYKPVVKKTKGSYAATALVGTYSASIGWDVDPAVKTGLHGFAVRKSEYDVTTKALVAVNWLRGEKRFAGDPADGIEIPSSRAPFQRFRWSDYTLKAHQAYKFEIFPVRGTPMALTMDEPPVDLVIRPSEDTSGGLGVHVNRGVTSAFAYLDRFKLQNPADVADGSAYRWLSRGLKEALLDFIAATPAGDALHLCIYEFFDVEIAAAFAAARQRGVDVRIVYHAPAGDKATLENEHVLAQANLGPIAIARTNVGNISHNKFIVHLSGGAAVRLFTGTANFTENAFYFQTNAALTINDPNVAAAYQAYFAILADDPLRTKIKDDINDARNRVNALMATVNAQQNNRFAKQFFSPLRSMDIVECAVDLIQSAQSCVFVSSPFGLDKDVVDALLANNPDILQYGLANTTAKKKIEMLSANNTRFFTPSRLETYMGRAWDSKAFGQHKIHIKMIAVDPWGDNPRVLFGSANFSEGSCKDNDENAFLSSDPRLTAILTTEFLRMFDHYKSRAFINQIHNNGAEDSLSEDGSWMTTSFNPASRSHKFRDRLVFMGG